LSITRTDLINDDLGAFADNAIAMGRKAVTSREKALFTVLNATGNGTSFFTTARANYFEGAATALSLTSISTAVQMFRDQRGPDGDPIMIEPRILLVPTALETTAREAMASQFVLGPTTAKTPAVNIWQNAFTPITSPWLSNTNLTGASSTAWYLLADPADMAALKIAYLNGQQTPTVEFFGLDADPNVLGVTWRVYWDFGVALAEYRSGVKSKGAA
jgi:phage major head subunit gpT-like protein